jgi:Leucine-rich repeat (LRR) protein
LYIGGNSLIEVPDSIGHLSELTSLGLAENQLENIPASIANCHKLRNLSLHNNKLKVSIRSSVIQYTNQILRCFHQGLHDSEIWNI